MNTLSIVASFGALVWIFQDGNLSALLGFQPLGFVETTQPVILFCVLFGLSMDYEVFLLSRMKEQWDRTGDNQEAVARGLERSGRIVTSAALIVVVVAGSFAFADIVLIKALGLGDGARGRPRRDGRPRRCSCRRRCACSATGTGGCRRAAATRCRGIETAGASPELLAARARGRRRCSPAARPRRADPRQPAGAASGAAGARPPRRRPRRPRRSAAGRACRATTRPTTG